MASTIKIRRSATASAVPTTGQLALGELAVNTFDGKLFLKKDNGTATIVEIGAGGGGGTTFTASSSAPGSPSAGDEWLDTDSGILYTYVNDGSSSQWVELGASGVAGSTVAAGMRVTLAASTQLTWTNMPSAVTLFIGSTAFIQQADLTNYTECRLRVNKLGNAGATGSKLLLMYSTTYTQTATSYSDIGTSEVSVAVTGTNTYLDSGWINLATAAKAEVYLSVLGINGNATNSPIFGHIVAEFR